MTGLNLLVTGRHGVGKTTLLESVLEQLRGMSSRAGFTTAEVCDPSGQRTGFRILTVEGKEAELARVGFRSPVRVGRYGVNLEAFERLALPELARRDIDLIVIDEIGKMECVSGGRSIKRFRRLESAPSLPLLPVCAASAGQHHP
jgi:nucleoside-triphosphatase